MNIYEQQLRDMCKVFRPEALGAWKVVPTGNYILDFYNYTDGHGGGLSNDKKDSASKNMPPEPYKDNEFYHTSRDVTWTTYCRVMKKNGILPTPAQFYEMSDEHKMLCVKDYVNNFGGTQSELINVAIASMEWGGSRVFSIKEFEKRYGTIPDSITKNGELQTLQMIVLARIAALTWISVNHYKGIYTTGWTRSCLCFWNLFQKSYEKNNAKS